MTEHGLTQALSKSELIFLTKKKIETRMPLTMGTEIIETTSKMRSLGVIKLRFWLHINSATEKKRVKVNMQTLPGRYQVNAYC